MSTTYGLIMISTYKLGNLTKHPEFLKSLVISITQSIVDLLINSIQLICYKQIE